MVELILCSVTFFIFICFDLVPIYKKRKWKPAFAYSILILGAYVLHVLIVLHIDIPSPAIGIRTVVEMIKNILQMG